MFRSWTAVTLVAAACAVAAFGRDEGDKPAKKASVEPVSLSVNKKLDEKDFQFPPFGGVYLSVLISHPGKQILGIDQQAGKVSELKDDKGTSLLATGLFKPSFVQSNLSKNREKLIVSVNSGTPPSKGSTRLTLKGEVVLRCGLDEKTTEAKEVEIKLTKADDKIKVGDYTIKITQEKGFGESGATFTLSGAKPGIKSLSIKDDDGKEVEYNPGFAYQDFQTKEQVSTFFLRRQVKKMKLAITYYNKEEKVTVPVNVSISIGL